MTDEAISVLRHLPVLIHAPLGRDALQIAKAFEGTAATVVCADATEFAASLRSAEENIIGMVIIAQEGATERTADILREMRAREPEWSRLPILFLVSRASRPPVACRMLDSPAGASTPFLVLERPVKPTILRRVVEAQLAARQRQFETAELLNRLAAGERRQAFLLNELRHRTGNMLAVLQAVFRISARRAHDLDALVEAFSGRLRAMGKAYETLSSGVTRPALPSIVEEHVLPYCASATQLRLDGLPVEMAERTAYELSLIFHELATNAAKYGSLSREDGSVTVCWSQSAKDDELTILWQERGGPPVRQPERKGLGSEIIAGRNFESNAVVELCFDPAGLTWTARLPLSA